LFKHILIPTDGSRLAAKGVKAGVKLARSLGAQCTTRIVKHAQPWQGILKVARAAQCDAIVMPTHGRGGIGGLILGSETQHVLARSKIPVVVIR